MSYVDDRSINDVKLDDIIREPRFDLQISEAFEDAYSNALKDVSSSAPEKKPFTEHSHFFPDVDDSVTTTAGYFDYNQFFQKLMHINCTDIEQRMARGNETFVKEGDEILNLCDHTIQNYFLFPMSRTGKDQNDLFEYLKKYVYMPLGLGLEPKFTFQEILTDALFLENNKPLVDKDTPVPKTDDFFKEIKKSFDDIERYSTDFDNKKNEISAEIFDVLRKFHVFWNSHRQRHQLNSVEKNTQEIFLLLLQSYVGRTRRMRDTALQVLDSIKEGYFRFLRAHRMSEAFARRPLEMIALNLIRRYKQNIEMIRTRKSSLELLTAETSYMLDILRAFFVLNYKMGVENGENVRRFEVAIFDKLTRVFDSYKRYMLENGEAAYEEARRFTALLLLKMRHRRFIIFEFYGIQSYVGMPSNVFNAQFSHAAKLYYELRDRLLMVPDACRDTKEAILENCAYQTVFAELQSLYNDFQLFASVSGMDLLGFLRAGLNSIFDALRTRQVYDCGEHFRKQYFLQLGEFLSHFRENFGVHQMQLVDDLENEVGQILEKYKQTHFCSGGKYELIDKFDQTLYEFFIAIKVKYNKESPINKNVQVIRNIAQDLKKVVSTFYKENVKYFDKDAYSLIEELTQLAEVWLRDHSVQFVVNVHDKRNTLSLVGPNRLADPTPSEELAVLSDPVTAMDMVDPFLEMTTDFDNAGDFDVKVPHGVYL